MVTLRNAILFNILSTADFRPVHKAYNSTNIPFRNYINIRIELIDIYATNDRVCKVPTHSLSAWPLDMICYVRLGALAEHLRQLDQSESRDNEVTLVCAYIFELKIVH